MAQGEFSKQQLRERYLGMRRALSEEQRDALVREMCSHLDDFSLKDGAFVHLFLPIKRHLEPNTLILKQYLTGKRPDLHFVLSKTHWETGSLEHFIWDEHTRLKENRWGIPEPVEGQRISPQQLDLIFVPLLAFDQQGHRVGYGKGFYDRFLSLCRQDARKVGLSFFDPVPEIQDTLETDFLMDACITPARLYRWDRREQQST